MKCQFYLEIKGLKEGDSKTFTCDCKRHHTQEIVAVVIDGIIREMRI